MASVNKVILIGNLCADPESRSFQSGGKVANFRLATNESWKDKSTGERKERAEFHTIAVLSDGLVGVVERFLRKGSKVYVEGQLRTRKWQDNQGNDRYSTEVALNGPNAKLVMLDGANQDGDGGRSQGGNRSQQGGGNRQQSSGGGWGGQSDGGNGGGGFGGYADDLDDDLPF